MARAPRGEMSIAAWLGPASALLFLACAAWQQGLGAGLVLVCVFLLHEGGHAAAMRALGYRNVRVVLVPFAGGVAMGDPPSALPVAAGLMLLAGPAPGIVLALLLLAFAPMELRESRRAVTMLLAVNGLNLLPLHPLDGGRIVTLSLFGGEGARARRFGMATSAVVAVGGALSFSPVALALGALGAFLASRTPVEASSARDELGRALVFLAYAVTVAGLSIGVAVFRATIAGNVR